MQPTDIYFHDRPQDNMVVQEISNLKEQLKTAAGETSELKAGLQALSQKSAELQADLRQAEQAHDVINQQLEVSCLAGVAQTRNCNQACARAHHKLFDATHSRHAHAAALQRLHYMLQMQYSALLPDDLHVHAQSHRHDVISRCNAGTAALQQHLDKAEVHAQSVLDARRKDPVKETEPRVFNSSATRLLCRKHIMSPLMQSVAEMLKS